MYEERKYQGSIQVDSLLSLMGDNELAQRMQSAKSDYFNAKTSQEPLINEIVNSFKRINLSYEKLDLSEPFSLDYQDIEKNLTAGEELIKKCEDEVTQAKADYYKMEDYVSRNYGTDDPEGQQKLADANKKWLDAKEKLEQVYTKRRNIQSLNITKDEFMVKLYSYDYLKKLYEEAMASDIGKVNGKIDELTSIKIKKELSGISYCLEALKVKQDIMNKSVDIFKQISDEKNIELIFDGSSVINSAKKEVKVSVKKEEVKEEKEQEEKKWATIEDANELIDTLKTLNPLAKIERDENVPSRIYSSVPADLLILPEGFYYNEKNGITNKHNTKSGLYLTLDVDDLKETKESDDSLDNSNLTPEPIRFDSISDLDNSKTSPAPTPEPVIEPTPEPIPVPEPVINPDLDGKHKVIKSRRANMNKNVKGLLTGGAIGGVGGGVLGLIASPVAFAFGAAPLMIGGGAIVGIVVAMRKLYKKAHLREDNLAQMENAQTDQEKLNGIVQAANAGIDDIKNGRKEVKEVEDAIAPFAEDIPQDLDSLDQHVDYAKAAEAAGLNPELISEMARSRN